MKIIALLFGCSLSVDPVPKITIPWTVPWRQSGLSLVLSNGTVYYGWLVPIPQLILAWLLAVASTLYMDTYCGSYQGLASSPILARKPLDSQGIDIWIHQYTVLGAFANSQADCAWIGFKPKIQYLALWHIPYLNAGTMHFSKFLLSVT